MRGVVGRTSRKSVSAPEGAGMVVRWTNGTMQLFGKVERLRQRRGFLFHCTKANQRPAVPAGATLACFTRPAWPHPAEPRHVGDGLNNRHH